ncbi:hypothetical protein [Fimbriiglobus ruber]|uniref:Uncharacterized protein n=1 Tax=Fimbriiglobus ruber TaxID=1908690 RepID=A0A225DHI6_9BACT|nr:hypothetical protein [Fimbriiglobus ruber]OWK35835.1 hypothetical protein FRUB_08398 [Fimbriiglobus ruber]
MSSEPYAASAVVPAPPGTVPLPPVPGTVASVPVVFQPPAPEPIRQIAVYGHSNLFYFWPVWLVCFVFAGITYVDGYRMAVVPEGTTFERSAQVQGFSEPRDVLVVPAKNHLNPKLNDGQPAQPGLLVSRGNNMGVVFVATLLLVIVASTVTLRGLVSVIAVILIILTVVVLALLGLWNDVFAFVGGLDIRMNAGGYLAIGIPLFIAWILVLTIYDRQHYIIFDAGQIRVCQEIGDSELVMDSGGVVVEKKRNDVFRHWLLGFGSGDLKVHKPSGQGGQEAELDNVLGIGRKLVVINKMLQEKQVTS